MGQPARAPYQASPAAPAGPMLGQAANKPATVPQAQSPYAPHQTYPSAGGYDDSSYLNRFNDNKIGQQQPAQQGYQAQGGLHNYMGAGSQGSAASGLAPGRAGNDEDLYKNAGSLRGATSQTQQPAQQSQPQAQPQQQQQQSFGYQGYPQQNDWTSPYTQYGSRAGTQQGYWGQ
jgi:hypothetical protein